jgi:hypothetical protein
MNSIFAPFMRKFVLVFMDDILIYSKTLEEHICHLRQVFSVLQEHQLFIKFKKCAFAQRQIDYLVHILFQTRVRPLIPQKLLLGLTCLPPPPLEFH